MSIFQRIFKQTSSNQTSRVSHVNHKDSAHFISDIAHAFIVPFAAISRATTDNEFRFVFQGKAFHFIVVNATRFFVKVITYWVVENTRCVYKATMAKVSAVGEVQAHESVARVEASEQHGLVGLCARVRLNVSKFGTEKFFDAFDS